MSQQAKLFLTILARYAAVAIINRLVGWGVLNADQSTLLSPWLAETLVNGATLLAMAGMAWYAARSRFFEAEAARRLPPEATDAARKDLSARLRVDAGRSWGDTE